MLVSALCLSRAAFPAGPADAPGLLPAGPVTLAEARQTAFRMNWDLLAAQADVDIASARKLSAGEFPNPIVSAAVTKIPTDGQPASTYLGNSLIHRSYDSIASFNQLVEIGGKRSARRDSAQAGIAGAAARFANVHRQLDLAVTRAYAAVLLADEQVRVLRASAASLRQEADLAQTRFQAGDLSRADRDQISVASDRFELEAKRSEGDAHAARIQLEVLLGIGEARGEIQPAETLDQLAHRPVPSGWDGPATAAVAQRADVLAASEDVKRSAADLRLQQAQRIPDPTVLVQYEREPPDKLDTIGLGVSFPLPLWNRNRGNIDAARATHRQAELKARQAAAEAAADLTAAANDYRTAMERSDRYAQQILPASASVRQTVRFAYEKGGASLLDLLTAERNDNEVRLAATASNADLARAIAGLEAAMGRTETKRPDSLSHP